MSNLLFEIGTEEIPAGYIEPALAQIEKNFSDKMKEMNISFGSIRTLATPRRLTMIVDNLAERQEDIHEEILGPSAQAGFDAEGKPTKAAEGFARSKGYSPEELQIVDTDRGKYLMLVREEGGQLVDDLLPEILSKLIVSLSFPKSMRWGSNTLSFARPIQWLLALNGDRLITIEHEGLVSANKSRGHRFLNNDTIVINTSESYEQQLTEVNVVVDQVKRRKDVEVSVKDAVAGSVFAGKGDVYIDDDLLDTVNYLVEKPFGVCGSFDEKFLALPDEVLITSMKVNQKYFPIVDKEVKLLAGFVAVNNTKTKDEALTRMGHERVLRARLEDALFFFESDKNRPLDDLVPKLKGSIFQAKLGTMFEKSERLIKLSRILAEMLAPELAEDACRAAQLCKTDLLTDMVGEFPSLQGIMGHAYAALAGEKEDVALAIREHYMPVRAGSQVPTSALGALIGLADRIDTLAGCFGINEIPTGTADPFGLRRISLAIINIIGAFQYRLSLREVVHKALALYGDKVDGGSTTVDGVLAFVKERFRNDCVAKGLDPEAVAAATAVGFDDINDCSQRIEALGKMKTNAAFSVLASSYKRIKNITKDNQTDSVDEMLLVEGSEKDLYHLCVEVREQMQPMLADKKYYAALESFIKLKEPVDTFFDEVMVMAEDSEVRQNRLNLLTALRELVLHIGDISKMQQEG
ncbi:MAG: glycine--tRNA ligase subunit beta [Desulfocapsaceae bacterium]|nr:glycine--tRNA ligase subunit beta [Desulfocapsaceae bacterium]